MGFFEKLSQCNSAIYT